MTCTSASRSSMMRHDCHGIPRPGREATVSLNGEQRKAVLAPQAKPAHARRPDSGSPRPSPVCRRARLGREGGSTFRAEHIEPRELSGRSFRVRRGSPRRSLVDHATDSDDERASCGQPGPSGTYLAVLGQARGHCFGKLRAYQRDSPDSKATAELELCAGGHFPLRTAVKDIVGIAALLMIPGVRPRPRRVRFFDICQGGWKAHSHQNACDWSCRDEHRRLVTPDHPNPESFRRCQTLRDVPEL